MRIAAIEIHNLLGTKHTEFKPGTLTVISGKNGEGKTSIITAVKKLFEGGHDPSVLRRGTKFGEVTLTLDSGATIKMRVTASSTTYEVRDEAGKDVEAPRTYIDQLGDALAVDPAQILLAPPKKLAEVLLEVMPIRFTEAELNQATKEVDKVWPVSGDMSLDQLETLSKQIYDARTTANRSLKDAETTVAQLRRSLPETDGNDWSQTAKHFREQFEDTKLARDAAIAQIDREERDAIEGFKAEMERKVQAARQVARDLRSQTDAEYSPTIAKIHSAIESAEAKGRDYDRAEGIRLTIQQNEKQGSESKRLALNFSEVLDNLKTLKEQKLANLPIPGIEVREGSVFADGIPFERVNLATRIQIAFQISALRAGKLPFLLLDNAEAFDPDTWSLFQEGAIQSGFQVIVSKVSDSQLTIDTAA